MTVLGRWIARLIGYTDGADAPRVPPVAPAPPITTTSPAEKRRIEDRLNAAETRLAELQALAGLDELRGRRRRGDAK